MIFSSGNAVQSSVMPSNQFSPPHWLENAYVRPPTCTHGTCVPEVGGRSQLSASSKYNGGRPSAESNLLWPLRFGQVNLTHQAAAQPAAGHLFSFEPSFPIASLSPGTPDSARSRGTARIARGVQPASHRCISDRSGSWHRSHIGPSLFHLRDVAAL